MWSLRKKEYPADTPYGGLGNPSPTPPNSPNDNTYAPLRPFPISSHPALRPSYPPSKPSYPAPIQSYPNPVPASPAVINNNYGSNSSGGDMLTGVLIGNMIANSGNHSSHTDRIVEREVIVERPVYRDTTPSYTPPASQIDKSWDDTPAPTKSSSWDDTPSKSSSWDDSSSKTDTSWSDSSSSSSSSSDGGGSSDW
jgi:hypothetical protein